jgi:hypothetical protein
MKKTYDDSIWLFSNREDRKIPPHSVSGKYYSDPDGFVIFELESTKRDFANSNITIAPGHFLLTDDLTCHKIVSLEFAEKRPKFAKCKTVITDKSAIPHYFAFNFRKGTYLVRQRKPRKKQNTEASMDPNMEPAISAA